jgi:EAL domain-containing protein (putative c-di-GMP-specific phosphodiesterase class I)
MRTANRGQGAVQEAGLWLTAGSLLALTCGGVWLAGDAGHLRVLLSLMCTALLLVARAGVMQAGWQVWRTHRLRRALARGQIRAWYQPVVRGGQGQVCGCEVLARWHLPGGRVRGAARFIPLAEESGLVVPLTRVLMRQVRRDLARMQVWLPPGFDVSVNLSAAHAGSDAFLRDCRRLQQRFRARALKVTAEVTERVVFEQVPGGARLVASLQAAGVRVMLDDFATGCQGMSGLDVLAADGLKLDRSHVRELPGAPVSQAELIIRLARLMSLEVVAEGVETRAQHEWLLAHGVQLQQGYYFSPPVQAQGLAACLASGVFMSRQ